MNTQLNYQQAKNTAIFLRKNGFETKISEKQNTGKKDVVDLTNESTFDLILNTSHRTDLKDSILLRRAAILSRTSYVTTTQGFSAMAQSIIDIEQSKNKYEITSINEWITST